MRRTVLLAALLLGAVPAGRAIGESPTAEVAPDPAEAGRLARQGLDALAAGRAEEAADLFAEAARRAPDAPELRYDRALALEKAGKRQDAAAAYVEALTGADGEAERRSLFNLGTLRLEDARGAMDLLRRPPEELAADLRDPDGNPLPPEMVQQGLPALRRQLADQGIEAAGDAVRRLRDLVRRAPDDADATRNLEMAQRTLRELRRERESDQEEQQQDEQGEQNPDQERQDPEQDGQKGDRQQDQEQEQDQEQDQEGSKEQQAGKDEQQQQEDRSQAGGQESEDEDERSAAQAAEGEQSAAEQRLEKMLEAAAQRAREVRAIRESQVRRAPVEKDW